MKQFIRTFGIGALVGAILLGGILWYIQSNQPKSETEKLAVTYDKIAIIQSVQKENKLVSVTTTVQRNIVIKLDLGSFSVFNVPLLENKKEQEISVTAGIGAGIDLSKLAEKDFVFNEESLTLTLPQPEILYANIVEDKTDLVKDDVTFLFQFQTFVNQNQRLALNEYLLQQILKQSKEATTEAACTDGILEKANKNAESSVTNLLKLAGVKEVKIITQKAYICKLNS